MFYSAQPAIKSDKNKLLKARSAKEDNAMTGPWHISSVLEKYKHISLSLSSKLPYHFYINDKLAQLDYINDTF